MLYRLVLSAALVVATGSCQQVFGLDHPGLIDAGTDASNDHDGDGVLDDVDNCPEISNPGQEDDDVDHIGDVCDPCPISSNNTDGDGDGVGDDCDPHPQDGGDTRVLFESFNATIPPSWTAEGSWTVTNGTLTGIAPDNTSANLLFPAYTDKETITVGVTVTSAVGTGYRMVGVKDNGGPTGGFSIDCAALITPSTDPQPNMPILDLFRLPTATALQRSAFAWTVGTPMTIALTRNGTNYNCTGIQGGTSTSDAGGDSTVTPNPIMSLRIQAVTAEYAWVLVVTSP